MTVLTATAGRWQHSTAICVAQPPKQAWTVTSLRKARLVFLAQLLLGLVLVGGTRLRQQEVHELVREQALTTAPRRMSQASKEGLARKDGTNHGQRSGG